MSKDYDAALSTIYDMLDNGLMSSDDVMEFFLSYYNQNVEVLLEIINEFEAAIKDEDLDSDSDDDEDLEYDVSPNFHD